MIKKILLFTLFCFFIIFFFRNSYFSKSTEKINSVVSLSPTPITKKIPSSILFVPYWTLGNGNTPIQVNDTTVVVYFGIEPSIHGINTQESGFENIERFFSLYSNHRKPLLAIRMLDDKTVFSLISDKKKSKEVIESIIVFAKEKKFGGVVLDIEVSSLPFGSVVEKLNAFVSAFSSRAKINSLETYVLVFGDVFYKYRSYDVSYLAHNSDGIFVMAYDYHKAGGTTPGPNFPFDTSSYSYSYQTMVEDFLNLVPKEKISIIFGMFGYDWKIDEKGNAIDTATPFTTAQIEEKFATPCFFTLCKWNIHPSTKEKQITYQDTEGNVHVVWYEDKESMEIKKDFAQNNGIDSFGMWAYSYYQE